MPYPLSDHFNGTRFFNPEPTIRSQEGRRGGMWTFLTARLRRDQSVWATWPKHVENTLYSPPEGDFTLTWIGHSTFLIRFPGLNVLTDPVFSERCSPVGFAGPRRVRAPGIALADLPRIDIILLSHNHYDHMDIDALRALHRHSPGARIVTMLGNAAYLAKKRIPGAIDLDWWQETTVHGAHITGTPARHFSARTLWDRNETLWGGLYLNYKGHRIFFAGDTGYTKYFAEIRRRLGAPTLAMLPIGAYEPRWMMGPVHLNPADAVQAMLDLHAVRAVGMHFGTFQLTAEPIDAPLHDLRAAMRAADQELERFFTLDAGESAPLRLEAPALV
ncbi:MBL fold metallo-hydrolase [Acidocella sp.]|uniref:MBL fold metallo-hydrolase n=1 Tax=Acidocella sp. TaxID=50710 RepID=UPI0026339882|nr:MBL fold metallo-hydrolase [Acidocella sp.]